MRVTHEIQTFSPPADAQEPLSAKPPLSRAGPVLVTPLPLCLLFTPHPSAGLAQRLQEARTPGIVSRNRSPAPVREEVLPGALRRCLTGYTAIQETWQRRSRAVEEGARDAEPTRACRDKWRRGRRADAPRLAKELWPGPLLIQPETLRSGGRPCAGNPARSFSRPGRVAPGKALLGEVGPELSGLQSGWKGSQWVIQGANDLPTNGNARTRQPAPDRHSQSRRREGRRDSGTANPRGRREGGRRGRGGPPSLGSASDQPAPLQTQPSWLRIPAFCSGPRPNAPQGPQQRHSGSSSPRPDAASLGMGDSTPERRCPYSLPLPAPIPRNLSGTTSEAPPRAMVRA
ncbi:uncharacterized protein LOC129137722 [Pan troglodytes]|uniref:uncharacterized protein LOC129137722 n=1 Tax=Pan troglodytes TaxID=9598 RepID=UPI0023F4C25F|nr:uncharacterized protein LOC129137722 [Pan troglodytes]